MNARRRGRVTALAFGAALTVGAITATACSSSADDKSKPDPAPGSSVPAGDAGTTAGSTSGTTTR